MPVEDPSRGPSLWERLRAVFGLRRRVVVDGVTYLDRTGEPLRRALSRKGDGRKEYDVIFTDGSRQRIRCTLTRVYGDVAGTSLLSVYALCDSALRPGMRVLDAAAGTGYGSAWLVERVGPSGAVVALDRDRESIRFAQARYRAPNVGYEVGFIDALAGEVDGAFDAVVAVDAIKQGDDDKKTLQELWRVVAPGGWLLVASPLRPTDVPGDGSPPPARTLSAEDLTNTLRATCSAEPVEHQDDSEDRTPEAPPEVSRSETPTHVAVLVRRPAR